MGLAFVPFYIKLMGVESYGLVGVFTSLTMLLSMLDLGLSQSMNREMARLSANSEAAQRTGTVVRTLEVIYWSVALVVAALILSVSHFIAYHWLNPQHLSRETLQGALWIIALVIGARWPVSLYMGGLNGLQRQVLLNKLAATFATLQGLGALGVLWFIEPSVRAFFMWQALVALLQVLVLRQALWRSLPRDAERKFRKDALREIWRFAAGMTGITLLATILTQADELILSRMLTLSEFGYYAFATTLATIVFKIVGPIFSAFLPRLTELVYKEDEQALVKTYHQACQLMAVAILPVALIAALFAPNILTLWVRSPDIVHHASILLSLLVIGNALNGLVTMPYALQLANGWTKLAFYQNIIAVILLVPAIYWAALGWEAAGAAAMWIVLNAGYVLFSMPIMHRFLFPQEKWSWYVNDLGKIALSVAAVAGAGRILIDRGSGAAYQVVVLAATLVLSFLAAVASASSLRGWLQQQSLLRALR